MKIVFRLVILSSLALFLIPGGSVKAQQETGNDWSTPVNLSGSGSATAPGITLDVNGIYHVLWKDEFSGPIYTSGNETGWLNPSAVALPIGDALPTLLADPAGNVHILWVGSDGGLYYSRANANEFIQTASAESVVKLSESALDFDAALDSFGNLHLSYIKPTDSFDNEAGVYYQYLNANSGSWSSPIGLYYSPYFRSLDPQDSNVDLATSSGEAVQVYVTWDNRPRERVYLAKSLDGGQTWGEAEEIDKSDSSQGFGKPLDIQVTASGDRVLLVWEQSNPSGNCSFQFRWSGDSGSTWTETGQFLDPTPLCGEGNRLLNNDSGTTLLWTILQSQVNLVAWDWDKKLWSNAQAQYELSSFTDPETSNEVSFGCQQPELVQNNILAVVGCDTSESGGDIWFTNRRLSNIDDWFPDVTGWNPPIQVLTTPTELISPLLVSGPGPLLHVLWSQAGGVGNDPERTAIYYIGGDEEVWTQPVQVIQSPEGSAGQPSAAIDDQSRLLVAWSSIDDGKILFSWANAARASNAAEWSDPVLISNPDSLARSPYILVGSSGTIFVIYSVPLNENRGVYLTSSNDGGETWTQPKRVFDGVSAGWQMIEQPQVTQTPDGILHALWIHAPQPGGSQTLGLFYARSTDNGKTWTEAEEVSDKDVKWSQITSIDRGSVYRNWLEEINGEPIIRYQHILEDGTGWSQPESLSSFGENLQNAKLVLDHSGTLHLLQIVQGSTGRFVLRHWIWEGNRWSVAENFELSYEPDSKIYAMAATASTKGKLDLIYSTKKVAELGDNLQYGLSFLNRPLDVPFDLPSEPVDTPGPTQVVSPTALPTLTVLADLQPTATPGVPDLNLAGPSGSGGSSMTGVVFGVGLAGLIVVAVLAYRYFKSRVSI